MSYWAGRLRVAAILLALCVVVTGPFLISGYLDLKHAATSYQSGDYASAAQYYRSAALKLPWMQGLWERQAEANVGAGDYPAATAVYRSLAQQGVLSAQGYELYGAIYLSGGRAREALDIWTTGLAAHPSDSHMYALMSHACEALGDYSSQRQWLEKWVATGGAAAVDHFKLGSLLLTSDPNRALQELRAAVALDPSFDSVVQTLATSIDLAQQQPDRSGALVVLGRGLGLVNQWSLADLTFRQAVESDAQNAQAWAWLGEAKQQIQQDGGPELDRALTLDSKDAVIRALRALYWKRKGEYSKELAEYQAAAQLDSQNAEWQIGLGEAYARSGDLVSALHAYQKATELAPDNAGDWRLLAMFCADNSVQVQEVGLPAAKKAAELLPNDAQVLDTLGWSYAQAGLLYNAEQSLREAVKLQPELALAHLHLGETYLRKGDQRSALTELQAASQLDSDGPVGSFAGKLLQQYFP